MLRHSSQICGEMSVDLLTNRKHLYEISGIFRIRQNTINVIWRLTLRRMLAESFELKLLCKNVAFSRRILIYITNLCTNFDRPQLSAPEGCCVFIGHEYIL